MNKKNIADVYPLSPMQQGMLFHSLAAPESGIYVEQLCCLLQGALDMDAFAAAWQCLAARNPILRTAFVGEGLKEPVQVVQRQITVPVNLVDWRDLPVAEQEEQRQMFLAAERHHGFDLSKAPLLRLALHRLDGERFYFTWTYHHILLDGWSLPILLQELIAIYETLRQGEAVRLPEKRPYRDYISWLKRQDMNQAEQFWRQKLAGFTAPTPLVVNCPIPAEAAERPSSAEVEIQLPQKITGALQALARQHQFTLNTFVQGAWALLLQRYSGEDDILFGVTMSGRPPDLVGSEQMVGLFINTLPLRILVSPEKNALDWLKALQMQQVALRQYEYSPLVQIQGWSDVPRGLPLFDSILVFENYPLDRATPAADGSLSLKMLPTVEQTNFPLTLVAGVADRLHLKIVYDGRSFDQDTIQRMLGHLETLLTGMAAEPTQPLAILPLLTKAEQDTILALSNGRRVETDRSLCAHELFERQVEKMPDAAAVVFGSSVLTYCELNERANQLAHTLKKLGVEPEVLVGICFDRSLEMIVTILGVLKAGGAYLPLDPTYPTERLAFMIEDAQPAIILTQESMAYSQSLCDNLPLPIIYLDKAWPKISQESRQNSSSDTTPENLAYIIYTSGSTGTPKGTQLAHRGLNNFALSYLNDFELGPGCRVLQFFAFGFDGSVADIFPTLMAGATLHIPTQAVVMSPIDLYELLQSQAISHMLVPPSLLEALPNADLPALRVVLSGGESCRPAIAARWLSGRRFVNAYGPTEATVAATWHEVTAVSPDTTTIPIGRPIANMSAYVLDRQRRLVPLGVPGELYIGGIGVARGYLNRPELTAEKIIPLSVIGEWLSVDSNQFTDHRLPTTVYRTGDQVRYRPDGCLEFLGRLDDQVKIRGFRIELGEIEATLKQHDALETAVVVAWEDVQYDKRLVAYLVAAEETDVPNSTELRQTLSAKLPDYMIPAHFIYLEALPLLPNGKINKRALPAPEDERLDLAKTYLPPRDTLEAQLVQIWEAVITVHPIGVRDNFFELGGHSLLAMRIVAQVQRKIDPSITLTNLFQASTVEQLAAHLRQQAGAVEASPLVGLQTRGEKRPFFLIHPSGGSVHWYADLARHLGSDQHVYGLQARGLFGNEPLHTQLGEMATYYIDAIQTQQPHGPYQIGSWSLGVIIAYEIAQQLQAQGEQVSLLALFDQGPALPNDEPEDDAAYLMDVFGKHLTLSVTTLRQLEPAAQIAHVFHEARRVNWITPDVELAQFQHFIRLLRTHTEAWRSYTPQTYPGHITLFRAMEQQHESFAADLGWGQLARDGVTVIEVPGDHITMLHEPQVQVLAQVLQASLARAEAMLMADSHGYPAGSFIEGA